MKKSLLPIAALLLIATCANAQSIESPAMAHADMNATTDIEIAAANNGPKKTDSDFEIFGYEGCNSPKGSVNFYNYNATMVASQFELTSNFVDYTVIGMRFLALGDLGANARIMGIVYDKDEANMKPLTETLTSENYTPSVIEYDETTGKNMLTANWNVVAFVNPVKITSTSEMVRYGLMYTETSEKENHILFGQSTETDYENMFLAYGNFGKGEGIYSLASKSAPNVPCFQLVTLKPSGEVAIIGIDGSEQPVEKEFFSLDGKKLTTPQKGMNIVKMSDGTTRKVMIGK